MTTLRLHDGETLPDAFERVTRERDELRAAQARIDAGWQALVRERDEARADIQRMKDQVVAVLAERDEAVRNFDGLAQAFTTLEEENARLRALLAEVAGLVDEMPEDLVDRLDAALGREP